MDMDVNTAIDFCRDIKSVSQKLEILKQLGLGYLTLDRSASTLSTGERQRMQLLAPCVTAPPASSMYWMSLHRSAPF